jgi:hypothetical protein
MSTSARFSIRAVGFLLLLGSVGYFVLAGRNFCYAYYLLFEASPFSFQKDGAVFFVALMASPIIGLGLVLYSYRKST